MDAGKQRISADVQGRLQPERFQQHGMVQNGVLLYDPRGTGKTLLAEATAVEFKINYWCRVGADASASEATATAVKPRFFSRPRQSYRRS
jgi:ATP-dependent 26S proteasome regulatory subunit